MAAAGISIATLLRMSGAGAADPALELYARYGAQLFRFCRRLATDADAAEDAVQATVLEAARLVAAGFRPEFESAWLFSLAQGHATDGAAGRPIKNRLSALPDELREPLALRATPSVSAISECDPFVDRARDRPDGVGRDGRRGHRLEDRGGPRRCGDDGLRCGDGSRNRGRDGFRRRRGGGRGPGDRLRRRSWRFLPATPPVPAPPLLSRLP
jgi:hypothetical protein